MLTALLNGLDEVWKKMLMTFLFVAYTLVMLDFCSRRVALYQSLCFTGLLVIGLKFAMFDSPMVKLHIMWTFCHRYSGIICKTC